MNHVNKISQEYQTNFRINNVRKEKFQKIGKISKSAVSLNQY